MIDKRLLREAQQHTRWFLLIILLGLATGVCAVLQADYLSRIISGVFLEGLRLQDVRDWLSILLVIAGGRVLSGWFLELAGHQLAFEIKRDLRQRLLDKILRMGPVAGASEQTGELTNLLLEGIENIEPYFARYLPQVCVTALIPLTILGSVFLRDKITMVILLITAPLIPVFMILIGKLAEKKSKQQWEYLSRVSGHFFDVLEGLTTLKLFGRSREQIKVIAAMSQGFSAATLNVLKIAFLSALVLELVATISTALVAVGIGLRLLYSQIYFKEALFVLLLTPDFFLPLRQLGSQFHAGLSGVSAAERIYGLLNRDFTPAKFGDRTFAGETGCTVAVEAVSFCYPGRDKAALKQVSFTLKRGEKTALIGPSGAGKSTLVNLLLGFLAPQEGEIRVNGVTLQDFSLLEWQKQIALVPQTPHLFCCSVADNIRMGDETAPLAAVVTAAKAAGAHEFIQALPAGYDTVLGDGGQALSGGEAKRIALARAFLKNAPLLILDEATTGLDPYNEKLLDESVDRLMQDKAVLIIAHRLSTVRFADQIVVLADGQVQESGTHHELIEQKGAYYTMLNGFQGSL